MTEDPAAYRCRCCGGSRSTTVISGIRDWEYGVEGTWAHLRCLDCDVVQLEPFPAVDLLVRAYDIDYHGYATTEKKGAIYSALHKINEAVLRRQLGSLVSPPARVLDVGCGAGEFLYTLRDLGYGPLAGIDFSARAISLVRTKGLQAHHGLFLDLPARGDYDLVVMNNYLEHTIDPIAEIRHARATLRPSGMLYGEIPNYRSGDRFVFGRYWGGNHAPRHTFHFAPSTLRALMEKCGFRDVRIYQQINTGHLALSIQNVLQRNRRDLRNNPSVKHGRASYYPLALLAAIPINTALAICGLSGIMKFSAKA
jgi:SAM-dependent methyltransferase